MPRTEKPKNKNRSQRVKKTHSLQCWFCDSKNNPNYKDVPIIKNFLSPRGKILLRRITGTCAAHQRKLSKAIKIARLMALLH